MEAFFCLARCRFSRLMVVMQLVMGVFVICISMASLHRFYTTDSFLPGLDDSANCARLHTVGADGYAGFDIRALADRVDDVLLQLAELQDKLEATALKIGKKTKKGKAHSKQENMTLLEFRRFLEDEVIHPLYGAHISLRLIRIPRPDPDGGDDDAPVVDPLVNFFMAEETRKYVTTKGNREGRPNVYGTNRTYGTIGHACVLMRRELDEYMSYDVGSYCPDDWDLLGAPFAETVALRGLVPLYATMSQRLPFFDNTMDMVHTAGFFEGWVDLQLLDFVLFDWDRVLRPGGLLWVDRFACARRDLDDYMYMFLQFRYKKHRWVVSFKSKDEVYLSALLEKPPRS
ncbi:unnamed protein product [Triticum turgidum subsp. durum]|uniref:Methyltransferase n=1 Tax=Triticum turgidum subsp. durum TaxID=4567 RepID=A0A9R0ZZ46_TRITD|nr:unnamed protein product [Triticum turgidum subsp. durum]